MDDMLAVGPVDSTKSLLQELSKDMTICSSMVDDCYVEKFDVACWHPRGGAEDRPPPSHKMRIGTNCETAHDDTGKFTVSRHKKRDMCSVGSYTRLSGEEENVA